MKLDPDNLQNVITSLDNLSKVADTVLGTDRFVSGTDKQLRNN